MRKILTSILILTGLISSAQSSKINDLWKLYNSGNFKSVIEKAKPLLNNDPGNIDLNLMTGRSYTELSDFENAVPYLESTVKNGIETDR